MTLAEFLAALAAAEPMILDAIKAEEPVVASSVQAAYDTIKALVSAKAARQAPAKIAAGVPRANAHGDAATSTSNPL